MTIRIFANPYDITAHGFYFSNMADFESLYSSQLPVEEYEIEFIDGSDAELALFSAMKVSQANLEGYFELLDDLGDDDHTQAAVCYILENHLTDDPTDAVREASDLSLFEGSVEDYAWNYLEDCVFTKSTPSIFRNYFDVPSFARDLELGGDVTTFDWCGRHFVVSGA